MSRRTQIIVFAALAAVLAIIVYRAWRGSKDTVTVTSADWNYKPMDLENPSLRLELLQNIRNFKYAGPHRNIFSDQPPPSPPPKVTTPVQPGPVQPPPPPPLVIPAKFFGYASDPHTGRRKAFFASPDGEDVYIVAEGETLMSRFRLLKINNTTADLEEIGSGKRATLVLEEQGPPA